MSALPRSNKANVTCIVAAGTAPACVTQMLMAHLGAGLTWNFIVASCSTMNATSDGMLPLTHSSLYFVSATGGGASACARHMMKQDVVSSHARHGPRGVRTRVRALRTSPVLCAATMNNILQGKRRCAQRCPLCS